MGDVVQEWLGVVDHVHSKGKIQVRENWQRSFRSPRWVREERESMLKLTATEEEGGAGKSLRGKKEEMRACSVSQDSGCKVSMLRVLPGMGASGICSLRRWHGL